MPTEPANNLVVGRLAPSPTGALHLGNARSFLLAWWSARQQEGTVLLRIEDIDSPRVKPWAVRSTIDDLWWLGIDWDRGPEDSPAGTQASSSWVQTQRLPRYAEVLEQLKSAGYIYRCYCSRSDVEAAASAPHEASLPALEGLVYPGTCRSLKSPSRSLASDKPYAWRWAFDDRTLSWRDEVLGEQSAVPSVQLGDFVIAKSSNVPAYQLAVVIDDHDDGVTEVVRGDDLVCSTYRQLAIAESLGWARLKYYHAPLVVGPDGRRLAKRHGDTRLSFLKEQGVTPEAVVGYLAWSLGMLTQPEAISATALVGQLDWSKVPRVAFVFDLEQDLPILKKLSR